MCSRQICNTKGEKKFKRKYDNTKNILLANVEQKNRKLFECLFDAMVKVPACYLEANLERKKHSRKQPKPEKEPKTRKAHKSSQSVYKEDKETEKRPCEACFRPCCLRATCAQKPCYEVEPKSCEDCNPKNCNPKKCTTKT